MMNSPAIFISGTDTNVGKTIASAFLVKLLGADYWKPIQCGDLDKSDSMTVSKLLGEDYKGVLHPERYALRTPQSPHLCAKEEGLEIQLSDFTLPKSSRLLIVEGAGGSLVPLNNEDTVIDLAAHLGLPVILVTRFYLGAYNHTLLSIEAIQRRGIPILGLILNQGDNREFREYISRKTKLEFLAIIPKWDKVPELITEELSLRSLTAFGMTIFTMEKRKS